VDAVVVRLTIVNRLPLTARLSRGSAVLIAALFDTLLGLCRRLGLEVIWAERP
jgi:hypothetical protein